MKKLYVVLKKLLLISCLFALASCDPGWGLCLENNSQEDQEVKIVDKSGERIAYVDSITIADTLSPVFETRKISRVAVLKTAPNAYVFTLPKGSTATLDNGIGQPTPSDLPYKIILSKSDTLRIWNDKRVKTYKRFMSTAIVATVK